MAMGTADTFWIDIEDASGNKVGPGPITTAEGWQWSPRLDEAGTFRFRVPASDPAAAHLVEKRVVRCYAMMDGVKTSLGAGVIDEVALDVGDPSMLEVSGPDLLAELSQVSVKQLRICEQGWTLLTDGRGAVHRIRTYWEDGQWKHEDAPRYAMFDGDFGTHDNILMYRYTYPHIGYLYVGHDARFDRARFTIIDRPNNVATTLHAQYFNGTEWTDLTIADGTESGGITMAQSGTVEWTRPTDWVRNTPTSTAGDWFWVRFTVGEGTSTLDSFRIEEVEVYADIPTTNGVNLIMQYAPPGWATSGYPATEAAHYIEFDGESILTALGALIEQGGQDGGGTPIREHFRLGSGRTLTWLGTTLTATGLRAVDADGISAEGADELCLIQHLSRQRDASGVVTRLYPFTADGIDLLLTTRSAPAGYTLVKGAPIPGQPWATASYLQRSSTLGVIEGWARFQDVGMQQGDSYLVHPEMAANALFDRALEYLRTHGAPQAFYDLTVAQVPAIILPGSTIDVVYHEFIDGYHAVDIDTVADGEPLVILASTLEVDNSGAVTTALEVATIDRQAASDASVIASSIRELRRIQGTTGGLSSYTTIHREVSGTAAITGGVITGVTIDNSPIGQLAPSTGAFTAIAVTNDIAVGGTVDGVDISAHAASDSAHHSPVTVGNTGLSIAGQQVSLNLAAVSGLEVDGGLKLADSIAGDGLTIASKVLAVGVSGLGLSVGADAVTLTSSSNPGAAASILASDASGYLQLTRLGIGTAPTVPLDVAGAAHIDGDLTFVGAQSILTTADSLTLAPAADLDLTPGGTARVRATSGVRLQSDNYVSQTTGWGIGYNGGADFRYLYADELHAKSFIADLEQALAGGQIIAKSVAVVAQDFTVPATAAGGHLYVEDLPGAAGMPVFQENDWVRLRQFSRGSGSLTVAYCTGYVASYIDQGDGTQRWYFYRPGGGWGGTATPGTTIEKGTLALDYGVSGNGFYEVSAIDGPWAENSPYAQIATWSVHPANVTVRSRWGNLKGIFNAANEYGLYAGDGVTDASKFLRISSQTVEAHNLPIKMYDGASATIALDPAAPSFAMGATLPSAYGTGSGLWMGKDGGAYKFRVGAPTGAMLAWDGSHLDIKAGTNNYLRAAGTSLEFYANSLKVIDITNAPSVTIGHVATNKGNMYWNPSNSRLEFRGSTNGTVVQAYVDTSGAIVAGGGGVQIDAGGITLDNNDTLYATSKVKWADSGTAYAYVASQYQVNNQYLYLLSQAHGSGGIGYIVLYAQSYGGAVTESLTLQSNGFMGWSGELDVESDLAVGGGLNLGTATGAGAGSIRASGSVTATLDGNFKRGVNLGTATGAGAGNIVMANSGAGNTLLSVRDVNDAFAERANIGHWDGGGGLFNLWDDAGTNTVKIRGYASGGVQGWLNAGRILIGTTSDDGVNLLQVNGSVKAVYTATSWLDILDGVAAPATVAGWARIYVDSADGDLKIKFGDGTVKTIVTD